MSHDPAGPEPRRFTYAEAKALVPEIRRLTGAAHAAVEILQGQLRGRPGDTQIQERITHEIADWARALMALGVQIKGLWRVDFDNGAGYYCWRWPEADLEFYHSYDEGFSGRTRIH